MIAAQLDGPLKLLSKFASDLAGGNGMKKAQKKAHQREVIFEMLVQHANEWAATVEPKPKPKPQVSKREIFGYMDVQSGPILTNLEHIKHRREMGWGTWKIPVYRAEEPEAPAMPASMASTLVPDYQTTFGADGAARQIHVGDGLHFNAENFIRETFHSIGLLQKWVDGLRAEMVAAEAAPAVGPTEWLVAECLPKLALDVFGWDMQRPREATSLGLRSRAAFLRACFRSIGATLPSETALKQARHRSEAKRRVTK